MLTRSSQDLKRDCRDITMIQELGVVSIFGIGRFFAARKNGINNIFFEPSFFKGRVFPLINSFDAPVIKKSATGFGIW